MTYVPIVVPPHTPSHQTRELADLLGRVITEYEKAHPSVSQAEVREAVRIALQVTRQGGSMTPLVLSAAAGLGLLMLGLFAYFFASGGAIDLSSGRPYVMIAVVALVGVLLPLIALLGRGKP